MSYEPYPKYKDSGIEWLGKVPEDWNLEKLKYNSYIKGRIGWQNLRSNEFTDEGPYLITGMHFKEGTIDWDACYHVPESRYVVAPEIQIKEKDVLITKDGTIGKVAFIEELPDRATLNSHLLVLRPLKNRYDQRYLYHVLSSNIFTQYTLTKQAGTTFFGITQEAIENFPIPFPSITNQQAIASYLDRETRKIDILISKKERQIELLKEKRTALIIHAVTKGLDPKAKMKESGVEWLGKIPEKWEIKFIKYFTSIVRGKFTHRPRNDPKLYDGPYPFIQTGDITNANKYIKDFKQTLNEDGIVVSKKFPKGTLVMTIAANIGDMAILDFDAYFPDSIVGYIPLKKVSLNYLFYLFNAMKQEFLGASTLNTQLNINIDRIGCLYACLPPLSEQLKISEFLDFNILKLEALTNKTEQSIDKLKEYRQALISATVTGKIDVREETA